MFCGIERRLDRPHDVDAMADLVLDEIPSCPARCHARRCRCRPCAIARMLSRATNSSASAISLGSFDVHQHQHMEIAVADMADDRRDQPHLGDVGLGLGDAFGEPRDRHADIGREPARAGPQRQRRPVGVVPRLPEFGPLLGDAGPQERPAAILRGDLAERLGLFGDAGVAAVELDEQARALRIVELRNSSSSRASAAR